MAFRRRLFVASLSLAVAAAPFVIPAAMADDPNGSAAVAQCEAARGQLPALGQQACRSVQAAEWGVAAGCRGPLYEAPAAEAPEACAVIDGRPVSEARVAAYEESWVHEALSLQRGLAAGAPLLEEQIVHTHNSFNSSAYRLPDSYPTLTNQDPNQAYSVTDQLRMDVRAVEFDVHWVPSPWGAANGGMEVTSCHGNSQGGGGVHVHVGCTVDRPFAATLQELRAWLLGHPHEFVLLYLENQLDGSAAGHERAGQLIADNLGGLVYAPPAGQPCAPMPVQTSATDILAAHRQVLLVGNCDAANGVATGWGRWVHSRGPTWDESGDPTNYGAAQCNADLAKRNSANPPFRRYFEEVTWLGAMGDTAPPTAALGHTEPVTADAAEQMTRCGVNIIGLDQLTPQDPRLAAQVWSWAPDEPSRDGGACAYQGADGRFRASGCTKPLRHFACVDAAGAFRVTSGFGQWDDGPGACAAEFPGGSFAVPANGWRNQQLAAAKAFAEDEVWLAYRTVRGQWRPGA